VNILHTIDQINGFGFPGESLYNTLPVPLKPFLVLGKQYLTWNKLIAEPEICNLDVHF